MQIANTGINKIQTPNKQYTAQSKTEIKVIKANKYKPNKTHTNKIHHKVTKTINQNQTKTTSTSPTNKQTAC